MSSNKKLGIISGMGTRAGLLFVDKLIGRIDAPTDQDFPEFVLHNNSQVPDRTLSIVYGKESPKKELLRSLQLMKDCKVDYIISACITSYFFIEQFENHLKYNILNPIDLAIRKLKKEYPHVKRVGLLATTGTIRSKIIHQKMKATPYDLVVLDDFEQEEKLMQAIYMQGGFKSAHILDNAFHLFQQAVDALKKKDIELIIGGCTEVQIGFSRISESLPYIDLVDVLVDEAIQKMQLNPKAKLTCHE